MRFRFNQQVTIAAFALGLIAFRLFSQQPAAAQRASFDDSLFIAPHYVEYLTDTEERFARQATQLTRRVGSAPHVLVGFAAGLPIQFPEADLNRPLTEGQMASTLEEIDKIVERARKNRLAVHISLLSGFFHGMNSLRAAAIQQDVRNAQWFADGWIAEPSTATGASEVPAGAWVTPSRYARVMRARMEEGARTVGSRLAARMRDYPETLLTISGDGEVELSFERSILGGEHHVAEPLYADYSPFMVEEFRDWIEHSRYEGDRSPSSDDNRDGHTFNRDFKTSFSTWRLRYFDSSGPIPYSRYRATKEKLPSSGANFIEGGFDAPRIQRSGDVYWNLWMQFRSQVIANYVRDFASWITTSPASGNRFTVPASRFYSHQIPAEFLFGQENDQRLKSSASPVRTAFISPIGSAGVTVFNLFDGKVHKKTGTAELFRQLSMSGPNWGILEYNPSIPVGAATDSGPSTDMNYYLSELRRLYEYRPHVIVPFTWSNVPEHKNMDIQNSTFEAALKRFIAEVGNAPWGPRRNPTP